MTPLGAERRPGSRFSRTRTPDGPSSRYGSGARFSRPSSAGGVAAAATRERSRDQNRSRAPSAPEPSVPLPGTLPPATSDATTQNQLNRLQTKIVQLEASNVENFTRLQKAESSISNLISAIPNMVDATKKLEVRTQQAFFKAEERHNSLQKMVSSADAALLEKIALLSARLDSLANSFHDKMSSPLIKSAEAGPPGQAPAPCDVPSPQTAWFQV